MLLSLFCYISPVKLVTQNKATPNLFLILLHFCLQHFEQANINNFNFNYVFCLDQHHNMVSSCTFYSYCSKTLISLKWIKFFFLPKTIKYEFFIWQFVLPVLFRFTDSDYPFICSNSS